VEVEEWRPGAKSAFIWGILALAVVVLGLAIFGLPALLAHRSEPVTVLIGLPQLLLILGLTLLLFIAHEGLHGLVMWGFGARPKFGATLVGRVLPAFYATAPGHRFSRRQYLAVAVAPAIVISLAGFATLLTVWPGYLVVPLAIHLSGCVGDAAATSQVVRQPRGTICEDLTDGIRFLRPASLA
jgi:hypothetical protein